MVNTSYRVLVAIACNEASAMGVAFEFEAPSLNTIWQKHCECPHTKFVTQINFTLILILQLRPLSSVQDIFIIGVEAVKNIF